MPPTPDRIMQLGLGFWGSKTLLSPVERCVLALLAARGPIGSGSMGGGANGGLRGLVIAR